MKKHYASLVTVLGLAMFGQAFAASSTMQLNVLGAIGAPGCTVTIVGGNDFDFGRLSPDLIKAGKTHTRLTPITKEFMAVCDARTYLTFSAVDAEVTSASNSALTSFGMGSVNGAGKLGYYNVVMFGARTISHEDPEQEVLVFSTNSASFAAVIGVNLSRGDYKMGWASAANEQAAATTFKAKFSVAPQLGGTTTMNGPVTEDVKIAGSLTLNFVFGL